MPRVVYECGRGVYECRASAQSVCSPRVFARKEILQWVYSTFKNRSDPFPRRTTDVVSAQFKREEMYIYVDRSVRESAVVKVIGKPQ
jgi:hypothetical protein